MIPVVTVRQMREIDHEAIHGDLAEGYAYMTRAGAGLLAAVKKLAPDPAAGDIAVVCGSGNNGGDGYVLGRLLLDAGYGVMCYGLCEGEKLRGEARRAFEEYDAANGNFLLLDDAADLDGLAKSALVVDAVLGTGIKGAPRGFCAEVIAAINASGRRVLAVDTPSGLDNDTGIPGDPCVKATVTVTMGFPKIGSLLHPGRQAVGELIVHDLGYPAEIVARHHGKLFLPDLASLRELLPPRKPAGSKFDHGVALMLCGSRGMAGSAALCCDAALRTGCGMVKLACPHSAIPVLSVKLTETVLHGIAETPAGTPAFEALNDVIGLAHDKQALCVGPGISHDDESGRLVRALVAKVNKPLVLDADGINAFKGRAGELRSRACDLVVTPHRGEWQRLFGAAAPDTPLETAALLGTTAGDYRMTILLKGSPTVIAAPDGRVFIMPFGTSALATAGTGDVLSGIITSLIAQGCTVTDAAILGAFIHGKAGELAAADLTDYSVIARDVIAAIPRVMRVLTDSSRQNAPLVRDNPSNP